MQLTELRKELRFNTDLLQLIETLKNIAAAQYHAMEKEKQRFDNFMNAFAGFFRVVNLVEVKDPLVEVMSDVLGLIIITSDSGFMGGLNHGVITAALRAQGDLPDDKVHLILLGDKGMTTLRDANRQYTHFPGIDQTQIYEQALKIKDFVVGEVLAKRMGKVMIAYPKPISFTAQTIEVISILPCAQLFDRDADSEVGRRVGGLRLVSEARKVIVESTFAAMVEHLAGVWVTSKLYEVFEDSKLAEFSARAMHLEGSLQKLEKQQKRLKHECFKATHERIDKGMRDTFSAKITRKRRVRPSEMGVEAPQAGDRSAVGRSPAPREAPTEVQI